MTCFASSCMGLRYLFGWISGSYLNMTRIKKWSTIKWISIKKGLTVIQKYEIDNNSTTCDEFMIFHFL